MASKLPHFTFESTISVFKKTFLVYIYTFKKKEIQPRPRADLRLASPLSLHTSGLPAAYFRARCYVGKKHNGHYHSGSAAELSASSLVAAAPSSVSSAAVSSLTIPNPPMSWLDRNSSTLSVHRSAPSSEPMTPDTSLSFVYFLSFEILVWSSLYSPFAKKVSRRTAHRR